MTKPLEGCELEVLHDHYKNTFGYVRDHIKYRERLFAYVLVAALFMLLDISAPEAASRAISEALSKKLGITAAIDFSFMTSALWFLLLGLVLKYHQAQVFIDRQYAYIHRIEAELKGNYSGVPFTREGESYLADYPLLSEWAHFLYTFVFPFLLVGVVVTKIVVEWLRQKAFTVGFGLNLALCLAVCITIGLVLIPSIFRKKEDTVSTQADTKPPDSGGGL